MSDGNNRRESTCFRPVGSYSFTPYSEGHEELLLQEIERLNARIAVLENQLKPVQKKREWLPAKWLRSR